MADKAVSELIEAERITATDLFVLEQNGTAKKLTGQILLNWLTAAADGHGGIKSITKLKTEGLVDTYRITLADTTTFDFVVTNGRSISSITKTATSGLVDTYTIQYNDNTKGTFKVTNGAKGDKGDNQYVWIKYASQEPTASSHSFGDVADNWIGVYSGGSATAPTDWTQYKWFQIKGEKGDTGAPAKLISSTVEYQVSGSGVIIPSGTWSTSIPVVAQGKYMWTRTTNTFNTGNPVIAYSVTRMGLDGSGSVSSVAGISPNSEGNVPLNAEHIGAVPSTGGAMTGELKMNGQKISGLNAPTSDTEAATKGYVDGFYHVRTYTDPQQFGCTNDSTLKTLYSKLPAYSMFICNASSLSDASWNLPNTSATLVITKFSTPRSVIQLFLSYTPRQFVMPIANNNGSYEPTGEWTEVTKEETNLELLWRNSDPTSTFAGHTFNIAATKYAGFIVIYRICASYSVQATAICIKDKRGWLATATGSAGVDGAYVFFAWREITITNTSVTVSDGMRNGKNTLTPETANDWAVPFEIYGFKGALI